MAAAAVGGSGARGGKWRRGRQRRQMGEINVTPFVDVMLVLLIVFMVTAPMPGQDEPLSVSIDSAGTIYLQESAIELEQLAPRLLAITEQNADARIFVRGDRAIDYGRVMAVIGNLNRAGFTRVALLTEQPDLVVAE